MATLIFNTSVEFLERQNKNDNGVSKQFAFEHPDFEAQNESNIGCWNCSDCSRCSDCSDCYDCSGIGNKNSENGTKSAFIVPVIENIHQKIFDAVSQPNSLNMREWHTCDTTHCRAGWVVHLAGKEGYELENQTSTLFAAMQIYHKSSPNIPVSPTRFFETNEKAMEDIKMCAEKEANQDV